MKFVHDSSRKLNGNRLGKGLVAKVVVGALALSLFSMAPLDSNAKQPIPNSKVFDLAAPGKELIRDKRLYNGTVQQSFAFDNVNQHIYIVQLMAGGQQLPGEDSPVSGTNRGKQGDLTLTKLDLDGNILGHMFLKGFGHGVQMGVEVDGDTPYLWTETDSVAEGNDGWGTQLARFTFEDGAILTPDSPQLEKHRLIDGADRTTVSIDPANELLTMRYRKEGVFHFALFDLEQVKQNNYVPLADVLQPPMGTFQGFTSYGGYLYTLEGNAYGSSGSVEPYGNTYITSVDWNTGKVVDRALFTGGDSLTFREPEGLAIRIPNIKHPQKAQLGVGFASNFTPDRWGNVYYLDQPVPEESLKR
ncbi:hypothetical protein J1P26_03575 [Neobacillus sp. MM2021_6]|uniref:phage baseplate protein n=1 Tax=Bacillaceae TaxID=186817 RepID=UPI00140B43CF|nr:MULTISPECIES: Tat pathway signal sequence domain protein [Bacillaceae]MBO0958802.1 hypothetical protein [Neobacillus sp. MM2021_6]NHC20027.1 Tat pathway signal sequence domain protein [Bacillus sp. MM2020_4]